MKRRRTLRARYRQARRPRTRILHTGEAIKDADKFFGLSVILASRIAAVAAGGEIVVSSLLQEITQGEDGIRFGASREVALKGISESQRIYRVEWEQPPT